MLHPVLFKLKPTPLANNQSDTGTKTKDQKQKDVVIDEEQVNFDSFIQLLLVKFR